MMAFLTLCFYVRQTGLPTIEVRGMTFSQSIEAPLTLKDTAIMSGQLSTRNGNGSGNINVTLHRNVSPQSWVNFDLGFGNGLTLGAKGYKNWTRRMFTNVAGIITFTRRGAVLGFTSSMPFLDLKKLSINFNSNYSCGSSAGQEYCGLPNIQSWRGQFHEHNDCSGYKPLQHYLKYCVRHPTLIHFIELRSKV
jgi:hypothetical protein